MRFEKVSLEQFTYDYLKCNGYSLDCDISDDLASYIVKVYEGIKLPVRSTKSSAGYDFFIPYDCEFNHKKEVVVPTGIKFECDDDKWLMCVPRSGLGMKYGMQLRNTIGVIDADYYNNQNNEGHIMAKIICDEDFTLDAGKGLFQAIITKYYVVDNDESIGVRNGGFGSTGM